jgi:hypothetical protein
MSAKTSVSEDPVLTVEDQVFAFLTGVYVQQSDKRQQRMGLQYTTAETHDLAKTVARFIENRRTESENRVATLEIQAARLRDERDTAQDELTSCKSQLFHAETA